MPRYSPAGPAPMQPIFTPRDHYMTSHPRARAPLAHLEDLADRARGVDEPDVGVRLREVAEQRAGLGIDVLGEQAERVRECADPIEHRDRLVEPAGERERLGPPERADRERAVGRAEIV